MLSSINVRLWKHLFMLGYVPSNLQVTFAQFKPIFRYFRFHSQVTEIPPF